MTAARKLFLQFFAVTATLALSVIATNSDAVSFQRTQPQLKDEPWDPQLMMQTVKTYVGWGSLEGTLAPDCSRFDGVFFGNKTWMSSFVVPNGIVYFYVEKSCQELAENLTWHSGSLEAGSYVYPFFYSESTQPYKVAFVWTAVGGANYREIFGLNSYDFTIISTMQFYNETAVFMAKDTFWPEGKNEVPDTIQTMIDKYMSFMKGNCKNFPEIFWEDYGFISTSGGKQDYYRSKGITTYCNMMMYEWSTYVYNLHQVTYSVSRYKEVVDEVTFTWTRTGLWKGEARTDEVLTELLLDVDDTPLKALKISGAYDYFQPHEIET